MGRVIPTTYPALIAIGTNEIKDWDKGRYEEISEKVETLTPLCAVE